MSKFSVASVKRASTDRPIRAVVYGPSGVGKTTFAAGAPAPVFITSEEGLGAIGAQAFDPPERFTDVLEMLASLERDKHDFKTVVVDSLDWLEPLVHSQICTEAGVGTLEDVPYGKLYAKVPIEWRKFIVALERVQRARALNVILIAHHQTRTFANPEGPDFDRVCLKLLETKTVKTSELLTEWADVVGYAAQETMTRTDDNGKSKAATTGGRVLHVAPSPARVAKSRYAIGEKLPLAWSAFETAISAARPLPVDDAKREIEKLAAKMKDVDKAKVADYVSKAGNDEFRLNQVLSFCRSKA